MKNNAREEKQNANEKETDADDFLQQIRTQVSAVYSFFFRGKKKRSYVLLS